MLGIRLAAESCVLCCVLWCCSRKWSSPDSTSGRRILEVEEGGIENQIRQVLKTGAGKCINCGSPSDLVEYHKVLKLFFVPAWRWPGKEQLMHCNNCNLFFPPSLSRQDVHLRCQVCGRGVDSDFSFCPFCGSSL